VNGSWNSQSYTNPQGQQPIIRSSSDNNNPYSWYCFSNDHAVEKVHLEKAFNVSSSETGTYFKLRFRPIILREWGRQFDDEFIDLGQCGYWGFEYCSIVCAEWKNVKWERNGTHINHIARHALKEKGCVHMRTN
jgi:hypothetical protein